MAAFCARVIGTDGSRHAFLWFVAGRACCAYVTAAFAEPRPTCAVLALALALRLGALTFMRLNTFVWAFAATCPSVVYGTLR
ncbi:hypothetical protein [Streptomyces sp. NPDC051997]|uniref:hypothetical protein n=1 Tax=Streptomyces sp. NPDC051997 TaxID=3155611 RepID=UPI0034163C7C